MLVPSMLYALMDHPDSKTRDLSSLETVYYGASAINPVRLAEAIKRFGPIFAQYYGQSEAPMVITYLAKDDHDEKRLTSCGRPTLFARVALLGDDGKPVPQGEPGEICVSGPLLAGGYWHLPEATADTFKDGWLHTGDMAREDEDGFYFIVDRKKDMIIRNGMNVYPREVEEILYTHPAVAEAAVFGVPDALHGEEIACLVTLKEGAEATADEIRDFVSSKIAVYKYPRIVRFGALPKGPTGKILKREIKIDA
jgi:fatty-acyl-CoA synthase